MLQHSTSHKLHDMILNNPNYTLPQTMPQVLWQNSLFFCFLLKQMEKRKQNKLGKPNWEAKQ